MSLMGKWGFSFGFGRWLLAVGGQLSAVGFQLSAISCVGVLNLWPYACLVVFGRLALNLNLSLSLNLASSLRT